MSKAYPKISLITIAPAIFSVCIAAEAAPSMRALESSIEGKTVSCGIEFTANDPINGTKDIILFKSALRIYSFNKESMFEFYLDAAEIVFKGKVAAPAVPIYVHMAWLRTSSGLQFEPKMDIRKNGQLAYQAVGANSETSLMLGEIAAGSTVHIGFNTAPGNYDKVYEIAPSLSTADKLRLDSCMERLLK